MQYSVVNLTSINVFEVFDKSNFCVNCVHFVSHCHLRSWSWSRTLRSWSWSWHCRSWLQVCYKPTPSLGNLLFWYNYVQFHSGVVLFLFFFVNFRVRVRAQYNRVVRVSYRVRVRDSGHSRPLRLSKLGPLASEAGGMQGIWHPNYLCGDIDKPIPPVRAGNWTHEFLFYRPSRERQNVHRRRTRRLSLVNKSAPGVIFPY